MASKKDKKEQKGKPSAAAGAAGSEAIAEYTPSNTEAIAPRFAARYTKEVVPALTKQFNYKNPMEVPRLQKITINMGLGAAVTNPKIVDAAVEELRAITGQKPVVTRARK